MAYDRGVIANTDEGDRVATTVADARYAGARLAERDAAATDRIVEAVGERLSDPETISRLALAAANETRRGHSGAKTEKIATAVDGARSHLRETPTTGVIGGTSGRGHRPRPVGVVGVAVPATHPVVVSAVVSLYALAGQNSVVLAPSPSAVETCDMAVEEIRRALAGRARPQTPSRCFPRRPQRPELTRCSSGSTSSSRPAPRRPSPPASAVGHPTCVPALTGSFPSPTARRRCRRWQRGSRSVPRTTSVLTPRRRRRRGDGRGNDRTADRGARSKTKADTSSTRTSATGSGPAGGRRYRVVVSGRQLTQMVRVDARPASGG